MPGCVNNRQINHRQQGFTLVEFILVMIITGIIAVGSTQFIVNSVRGLNDLTRRDVMANSLRTSIEKIQRQLARSAAASIRIRRSASAQCLEMLPIQAQAFYTQAPLANSGRHIQVLALKAKVTGMRALIGSSDANLYAATGTGALSSVIIEQDNTLQTQLTQLRLASSHRFNQGSAQQLINFVSTPLSYCLEAGNLYRYTGYSLRQLQPMPDTLPANEPKKVLLAQNLLASSNFSHQPKTQTFNIQFTVAADNEQLSINQQLWLTDE
ncbi:MAG: prepilin-type N-terminal cleavage/methylation domain-containing protein [Pseudomonadales bacterium]|nr:prepilin-type N-terminal cleavage/methylation domain-containing protein [Pseudomonadales bacterium]NRA17395.1 prepilin-type N-terminal cleavage/methylation domain-containing protein [Oceanospirillaceae bacterium]